MPAIDVLRLNHSMIFLPQAPISRRPRYRITVEADYPAIVFQNHCCRVRKQTENVASNNALHWKFECYSVGRLADLFACYNTGLRILRKRILQLNLHHYIVCS